MNTHADKIQEDKNQSVKNQHAQKQSTFQFSDSRPEAIAQRKLQEMVNNSTRLKQLKTFQEMASTSPINVDGGKLSSIQLMIAPPHGGGGAAAPPPVVVPPVIPVPAPGAPVPAPGAPVPAVVPAPVVTDRQRRINAVQAAIAGGALGAAAGAGILVFHPPTPAAPWEYTRTVQYTVVVPGLPALPAVTVRGHVHYANSTGTVGPGRMWISNVGGYDFQTPGIVVAAFNPMPSLADRGLAVTQYNGRHGTTHATL